MFLRPCYSATTFTKSLLPRAFIFFTRINMYACYISTINSVALFFSNYVFGLYETTHVHYLMKCVFIVWWRKGEEFLSKLHGVSNIIYTTLHRLLFTWNWALRIRQIQNVCIFTSKFCDILVHYYIFFIW